MLGLWFNIYIYNKCIQKKKKNHKLTKCEVRLMLSELFDGRSFGVSIMILRECKLREFQTELLRVWERILGNGEGERV